MILDMVFKTLYFIIEMVSKIQKKLNNFSQLNVFHFIITYVNLYYLGFSIQLIMVFDMVSKTPFMIMEIVSKIKQKICKLHAHESFSLIHH